MKEIKLTKGFVTLVDDEDFDFLTQWSWFAHNRRGLFYAARSEHYTDIVTRKKRCKSISMHRILLQISDPKVLTDHKDHDTLNNQKNNLRICNYQQNNSNSSIRKNNTSGYRGITFEACSNKWVATIQYNKRNMKIGRYVNQQDAIKALNEKNLELNGDFAKLIIL